MNEPVTDIVGRLALKQGQLQKLLKELPTDISFMKPTRALLRVVEKRLEDTAPSSLLGEADRMIKDVRSRYASFPPEHIKQIEEKIDLLINRIEEAKRELRNPEVEFIFRICDFITEPQKADDVINSVISRIKNPPGIAKKVITEAFYEHCRKLLADMVGYARREERVFHGYDDVFSNWLSSCKGAGESVGKAVATFEKRKPQPESVSAEEFFNKRWSDANIHSLLHTSFYMLWKDALAEEAKKPRPAATHSVITHLTLLGNRSNKPVEAGEGYRLQKSGNAVRYDPKYEPANFPRMPDEYLKALQQDHALFGTTPFQAFIRYFSHRVYRSAKSLNARSPTIVDISGGFKGLAVELGLTKHEHITTLKEILRIGQYFQCQAQDGKFHGLWEFSEVPDEDDKRKRILRICADELLSPGYVFLDCRRNMLVAVPEKLPPLINPQQYHGAQANCQLVLLAAMVETPDRCCQIIEKGAVYLPQKVREKILEESGVPKRYEHPLFERWLNPEDGFIEMKNKDWFNIASNTYEHQCMREFMRETARRSYSGRKRGLKSAARRKRRSSLREK